MEKDIKLKYTVITDKTVMVCGRTLGHDHSGAAMLAEIYRAHVGDWRTVPQPNRGLAQVLQDGYAEQSGFLGIGTVA